MACYDCEYCIKHINKGGKCKKFEYDCPYSLVECTDEEIVNEINKKVLLMQELLEVIKELDKEEILYNEVSIITNAIVSIKDATSKETIEEWGAIN